MRIRVLVGVVAAAAVITLLFFGGWFLWGLVVAVAVLSVYELHHAIGVCLWCARLPAIAFAVLFVPARVFLGDEAVLMLLLVCLLAACVPFALGGGEGGRFSMEAIFKGLFPLVYPLPFVYAALLVTLIPAPRYIPPFLLMAGCPLLSDVFALFGGKLFGKRKLLPRVSPNKTVEGSISGLVGGMAAGALIFALQTLWHTNIALADYLVFGLVLSAMGQLGDLFASALKRHCGIKDFGKILPGHGGVLDRVDSVLFCTPIVYIVFKLFYF